jgi:transcriptional regulator with XRE-family HTH domain
MEKLKSYLRTNAIPQSQFAEAVGISQSALSKMCAGIIQPSLKTAKRIATATDGAVAVDCWGDEAPAQSPAPEEDAA